MNQKKAMPANGSRRRLSSTALRLASSVAQAPGSSEPSGIAHSVSTADTLKRTENTSPATPAARGVLIARAVRAAGLGVMSVRA